jgi:NhaP-type Na+/H+ or K+/H+ antiporter
MFFTQLLIVVICAIAVTIVAEHRGFQAPLLVVLVGLVASFIPGMTRFELEPEIILTIVLPPLLYSTSIQLPFSSFMQRFFSIANLGVVLVVVSTIVVGAVAAVVVPGLTFASALVLAAVVSPPDAVTAVAIGRKLGLPKRMMTTLTGESLINDAAALTLFSATVAAVAGSKLFIDNLFLYFLYSATVGALIGLVLGWVIHRIRRNLENPSLMTALGLLAPFSAYLLAEEVHASGVIAVVTVGFTLSHFASQLDFASRLQERLLWPVVDALLEAFVFAYIGLQLRFVIQDVAETGYSFGSLLGGALWVLLAVIVVRIAWVFLSQWFLRWRYRTIEHRLAVREAHADSQEQEADWAAAIRAKRASRRTPPLSWRETLVVSWTGMRGVVTLAAAAGVPQTTSLGLAFPGRLEIQVVAFVVAVGTLLIQGLSLPWLINKLQIADPHEAELELQQLRHAQRVVQQVGLTTAERFAEEHLDATAQQATTAWIQRAQRLAAWRRQAQEATSENGPDRQRLIFLYQLSQEVLSAQRQALIAERNADRISDEVMRTMLEQLDLQEALNSQRQSPTI